MPFTGTAGSPHRWGKYHTYPTAKNSPTTQPLTLTLTHQPPHDSPATRQHTHACTVTDSVGHSTCMSVLARRRAIMRSIVQPKRSCLDAFHGYSGIPTPVGQIPYLPHRQELNNHPTANPNPNPQPPHDSPATRQHTHACTVTDSVGHSTCMSVLARRRAIMGSIVQPKRSCLGAVTGTVESPHRWGKYHTYPTAKNPPTTQPLTLTLTLGTAISPTRGVFSYIPHHLDLASEDSVGHSTCMSVLARRRAIVGSIVQPKRSCLGAVTGTAESPHRWGKYHTYPTAKNPPTTQPLTLTLTLGTAISPTRGVFSYLPHHLDLASEDLIGHSTCMSVLARRRAIMRSIVQPKRSCLGAATGTAESPHRWGKYHTYPPPRTHQPPNR